MTQRTVARRKVRRITVGRANPAYLAITGGLIPTENNSGRINMTNFLNVRELGMDELKAISGGDSAASIAASAVMGEVLGLAGSAALVCIASVVADVVRNQPHPQ